MALDQPTGWRITPAVSKKPATTCRLGRAVSVECFTIENLVPTLPVRMVRRMSTQGTHQISRVYVNGQRISRYDWTIEYAKTESVRPKTERWAGPRFPHSPIWFECKFIIPASYVTASKLEIRIETLDSDFPLDSRGYWFYQDFRLDVIDIPEEIHDLSTEVMLSGGKRVSLKALLDLSDDRTVALSGLSIAQTPEGFEVGYARPKPGAPTLDVLDVKRSDLVITHMSHLLWERDVVQRKLT